MTCCHSSTVARVDCACDICAELLARGTGMTIAQLLEIRGTWRPVVISSVRAVRSAITRPESRSSLDHERRPVEGPDR